MKSFTRYEIISHVFPKRLCSYRLFFCVILYFQQLSVDFTCRVQRVFVDRFLNVHLRFFEKLARNQFSVFFIDSLCCILGSAERSSEETF